MSMSSPSSNAKRAADPIEIAESPTKKLRSCEPDLRIIVKHTERDSQLTVEKDYHVYSQVLARQSKFVDASLSVDMKEKQSRVIVFNDVVPDIFEMALQLLDDPLAVVNMKPHDALQLLEFFDKYEFSGGLQLCDTILSAYIDSIIKEQLAPPDLDLLVDAVASSVKFHLTQSTVSACRYLTKLAQDNAKYPFHPCILSVEHVQRLQPVYLQKPELLPPELKDMTPEEVQSVLFPKYFVQVISHRDTRRVTRKALNSIWLQNTGWFAPECHYEYDTDDKVFYSEQVGFDAEGTITAKVFIGKSDDLCGGDWAIVHKYMRDNDDNNDNNNGNPRPPKVLWKCPYSKNMECPPKEHWVAVDAKVAKCGFVPRLKYAHSFTTGSIS